MGRKVRGSGVEKGRKMTVREIVRKMQGPTRRRHNDSFHGTVPESVTYVFAG
jgi:hypothetical protein